MFLSEVENTKEEGVLHRPLGFGAGRSIGGYVPGLARDGTRLSKSGMTCVAFCARFADSLLGFSTSILVLGGASLVFWKKKIVRADGPIKIGVLQLLSVHICIAFGRPE
jgi:tetrahydromethanopterin S-methyltransferase subunit E